MKKEEIEAMKDGTFEKIMDFIQTRPQKLCPHTVIDAIVSDHSLKGAPNSI